MEVCSKLLVIQGPTGVGKTELTLRLAERWGCPILNADSRQIYKEIPIGTAAPTREQMARVKHYFVGTKTLNEDYNAGTFERDCLAVLEELVQQPQKKQVIAILSGGSMLYIDAVCKGLDAIPAVQPEVRQAVREAYEKEGIDYLQKRVQELDPDYWSIVDRQNPQRLMHCVEVSMSAGVPYSTFRQRNTAERPFTVVKIGLTRQREQLYKRINQRVEDMMQAGLEKEARQVWQEPVPNSLNTVGYKELFAFFKGDISRDEAVRLIQQNSRHYAKRQMTWLRKDNDIHWLDAELEYEEQIRILEALAK